MNKIRFFLPLLTLIGLCACQPKSGQPTTSNEVCDSTTTDTGSVKTIMGIVKDASMNNFMLVTLSGDTVYVSTMDQNPEQVGGFQLEDTVKVDYVEEEAEPGVTTIPTAKKVVVIGGSKGK